MLASTPQLILIYLCSGKTFLSHLCNVTYYLIGKIAKILDTMPPCCAACIKMILTSVYCCVFTAGPWCVLRGCAILDLTRIMQKHQQRPEEGGLLGTLSPGQKKLEGKCFYLDSVRSRSAALLVETISLLGGVSLYYSFIFGLYSLKYKVSCCAVVSDFLPYIFCHTYISTSGFRILFEKIATFRTNQNHIFVDLNQVVY